MKTKFIIFIVLTVLIVGGLGIYSGTRTQGPGKLDGFAQCLKSSGAEFYGAFWCPHCQKQKELFGFSKQYLPYIECSTADGQGVNQICKDKKIEGYPTWIFADASRLSGELSLVTLASKTQCAYTQ
ncbi:MAG: thioredoxin domain-containing protein [Candidatus Nomurabacteria bacterium]|nr:thioredoxin domain-containing protein [Candidatus Nomurabacteria bacterium]